MSLQLYKKIINDLKSMLQTKDKLSKIDCDNLIKKYGFDNIVDFIDNLNEEDYEKYYEKISIIIDDTINYNLETYLNNTKKLDSLKMYILEVKKPLLSKEEEYLLACRAKTDIEARNLLCESNLRLVLSLALKYQKNTQNLLDLIQEGNLGLIEAIDKYNPQKGNKLCTYAYYYVKRNIIEAATKQETIFKIGKAVSFENKKYKRLLDQFYAENNRYPMTEEISKIMNISLSKVKYLEKLNSPMLYLDAKISKEEDEDNDFQKIILDNSFTEHIDEFIEQEYQKSLVNTLLNESNLTENEIDIIKKRFGINTKPLTLEEIGKQYNLSRERIRVISEKSMLKMKRNIKKIKY